jgi:hypothetical protein
MTDFEMLIVEKSLKANRECSAFDFCIERKQFVKHSIPISQSSNSTFSEMDDDSSKNERALRHFRKDIFAKTERTLLLRQMPYPHS